MVSRHAASSAEVGGRTPGKAGISSLAAESEAAREVARRAALDLVRKFGALLPR